jgi:hypothetical protein
MKGYALSQLPERFQQGPKSKALTEYIQAKYSQYGYRRSKAIEYNPESKDNHYRWVENIGDGLRKVGDAHEIVKRLGHTGWFTNQFQDETVHGEVYQLPARGGIAQYVPAVNDPCNDDCACVDFTSVTDDKEDAARQSDSMAERWAEREREYQAEESAKIRLEEITTEIQDAYKDFRRVAREIRANCDKLQDVLVVRELVRDKWERTKEQIHRLRRERVKIETEGYSY